MEAAGNADSPPPRGRMPVNEELLAAYRAAHYVVFGEPELVFHVGEPNAGLDALLVGDGAATAAYVTAADPYGVTSAAEANLIAVTALVERLSRSGYATYRGEGRDPQDLRRPEPSVLVVGIGRADAEALGRQLEQNAIVFIEKGGAPELVVLV